MVPPDFFPRLPFPRTALGQRAVLHQISGPPGIEREDYVTERLITGR